MPSYLRKTLGGKAVILQPAGSNVGLLTGNFNVDANWVKGTGITISGGKLNFTAGNLADARQAGLILVGGKRYRISYTISSYSSGSATPGLFGGVSAPGTSRNANGSYTDIVMANPGNVELRFTGGSANDTFAISNVSISQN